MEIMLVSLAAEPRARQRTKNPTQGATRMCESQGVARGMVSLGIDCSGDFRQGSSNNSVTNFVPGFSYIFQRETQPSFEDLFLVVLVILRRRFATRF